jgi:tRNA A58 N-methylase Trm61
VGKRTFEEAGVTLTLTTRRGHHDLVIGDVPILTSKLLGTERDFGRIVPRSAKRVVVGGLGFGSTVAGVLDRVGRDARVIVVEKLETVIDLVRGELSKLAQGALDDARVEIVRDDVRDVIDRERGLDAILLDVDNGPEWASFRANARLYDARGLAAAKRALRRGGMYAVWSGYPVDAFVERLRRAGFRPSIVPFIERGKLQARAYVGRVQS